ncbi:MAG TPA: hypothetical protein DDZ80_08030 [Cyanobacteria bacterium UBA8803]|nr:hypothetical protein [Cyanobacteria bacterium UBA9273]HBL58452.1 hypothetical protein [Cyanobacteria bacterium UBA8803]
MSQTMSKTIVDLGLQLVNEEIDNALELYPDDACKKVFALPELRQKLVDYVMGGIPDAYLSGNVSNRPIKTKFPYRSLELRLRVEEYVHWGIEYILKTHAHLLNQSSQPQAQLSYIPWEYNNCFAPVF